MIVSSGSKSRCLGIVRTVADLARSAAFYTKLGFERLNAEPMTRGITLRFGEMSLNLQQARRNARALPMSSHSNDPGFRHIAIVVQNMPDAVQKLLELHAKLISTAPQVLPSWNAASGGIEALYFRDPDCHPVEFIHFPSGKGKSIWHAPSPELFLGVDHTAIVVADTEVSLAFYRDQLGLNVVGSAHNYGPEQDNLSGVFGASVLVTSLAAGDESFTLELLEYLRPQQTSTANNDRVPGGLLWSETSVSAAAPPLLAGAAFCDPDGFGVNVQ